MAESSAKLPAATLLAAATSLLIAGASYADKASKTEVQAHQATNQAAIATLREHRISDNKDLETAIKLLQGIEARMERMEKTQNEIFLQIIRTRQPVSTDFPAPVNPLNR